MLYKDNKRQTWVHVYWKIGWSLNEYSLYIGSLTQMLVNDIFSLKTERRTVSIYFYKTRRFRWYDFVAERCNILGLGIFQAADSLLQSSPQTMARWRAGSHWTLLCFPTDQTLSNFSQNNGSLFRQHTKSIDFWRRQLHGLLSSLWYRQVSLVMLACVFRDHSITLQGNVKAWSDSREPISAGISCIWFFILYHKMFPLLFETEKRLNKLNFYF